MGYLFNNVLIKDSVSIFFIVIYDKPVRCKSVCLSLNASWIVFLLQSTIRVM